MKYYVDKIIVVEGKEDVCYLSSFVKAEFVTTNGYDIPLKEIEYLNAASKHKEILVMVDPDEAGINIENKLKQLIKQAIYLRIDINKCHRNIKNGVAECDKEEIINVLKPYFVDKINDEIFEMRNEFLDKEFRKYLTDKYHLGNCNLKKIRQRLKTLEISTSDIDQSINEFYGN